MLASAMYHLKCNSTNCVLIVTIREIMKNYIYRFFFKNSTHIVSWFILAYLVVNLLYHVYKMLAKSNAE